MTSIEMWNRFSDKVAKDANGNVGVPEAVRLFNIEQQNYMLDAIGDQRQYKLEKGSAIRGPELSTRMMNMLSAFITEPVYVRLTNRIGTFTQGNQSGDFAFGPYVWVSAYTNPGCGEEPIAPYEKAVEMLSKSEWMTRSDEKRYDGASLRFPVFQLYSDEKIEVRPTAVKAVWVSYIRKPSPITIAILPNGDPDPAGNNADPEWNDLDVNAIIDQVIGAAGLREQSQLWIQHAERRARQ